MFYVLLIIAASPVIAITLPTAMVLHDCSCSSPPQCADQRYIDMRMCHDICDFALPCTRKCLKSKCLPGTY
ncbi:hypothetical protein BC943DRAFT_321595 [Umbelopsis sp. AD052]|nr:hypothetical protein BC943DRAFT_321595 [Umbelopsis sp. AD052]